MELTKCKLGELITQRREKNDGSDLPICGVSKDGLIPPKQKDADTSIYNVFYRDDFIFNPARMELNSIAINDMYDRAICSSLYEVFYVHRTDLLLPHYLKLIVRQKWFARYCEFLGQGSAREYCRFGNISEIEIEFPPIEEQQKIVDYNTAIENRIALKQKINDNLDEQMKALFKSWFIDFEPFNNSLVLTEGGNYIPENWIETTLGEYVTYAQGTQVPVEEQYFELDENRVRFLRIVDYTGNTSDEPRYIEVKSKNSTCCPEDILIIRYGASAGQICRGLSGVFANNLFSITPTKLISNSYLYYLLTQPTVQSFITSVGETSSAMPALTHGLISSIPIVIPQSAKYLNNFAQIADEVFKQQLLNNEEIDVLMSLSKNLLANLSSR